MLMKMLKLLKQSIVLFFALLIVSFLVDYSGAYSDFAFTILGVSLFISALVAWFLPLVIVIVNSDVQRKGVILFFSLGFPVFGGVIGYLILTKQVKSEI
ncbi:hypothetical protein NL53_20605 [Vibrio variabilis]|uniref:Cardiolipin synthase N-terminal domain-containing protein n=3 Tax=Vibrio TaxID=662 RepID=A0ABR4Y5A9_9VIBR|nr:MULTISPECIES: hypothetical protein [Vibrio]KHA58674.1 hypothetical protein NL53_20605 [Vibrio variabilis]KIE18690.1 hypothetical protein SE23_21060 [Vibrio sinaloensis]